MKPFTKIVSVSLGLIATFATLASIAPAFATENAATEGAVYVATNNATENQILAFHRKKNGILEYIGAFDTGGRGSGGVIDPLQSQSSLLLSPDHSFLYATNAGSGEISVFAIEDGGWPDLIQVIPSGGADPVSLALHGTILFALNSAAGSNITAFRVRGYGLLDPIDRSTALLSSSNAVGSSLAYSPNGVFLAACELGNNKVDTFPVPHGIPGAPTSTPSSGKGVFALAFTPSGILLSVEAGTGSVSSYKVNFDGSLTEVTSSLPTGYSTTCWIVVAADGKHAYVANSASNNIGDIAIAANGALSVASTTASDGIPLDLGLSSDGRFLYALTPANGTITILSVAADGSLTALGTHPGAPAKSGQNGLAAY